MEKGPVKAVGEDWDDFKVVSQEIKINHHIEVARRSFGMDITREDVITAWGKGLRVELATFYGHPDPEHVTDDEHTTYLDAFKALDHEYPKQLQPDTLEVHEKLVASGLPLFMVTSHLTNSVRQEMNTVGVNSEDYLFIHGSDITRGIKPDPKAFELAIEILSEQNIHPHETIYGGDTLSDAYASTEAGMQFVGVPNGRVSAEEFRDNGFMTLPTLRYFGDYVLHNSNIKVI